MFYETGTIDDSPALPLMARIDDVIRLLRVAQTTYRQGNRENAERGVKEATARLIVVAAEIRNDPADALAFGCGHCGYECPASELNAGKCPRCGTIKDGVLVVPHVDKWTEREEAPLRKPQGHAVVIDGWMV